MHRRGHSTEDNQLPYNRPVFSRYARRMLGYLWKNRKIRVQLLLGHRGIDTVLSEQFLMAALFDNPSLAQDTNAIAAHNGAEDALLQNQRNMAAHVFQLYLLEIKLIELHPFQRGV